MPAELIGLCGSNNHYLYLLPSEPHAGWVMPADCLGWWINEWTGDPARFLTTVGWSKPTYSPSSWGDRNRLLVWVPVDQRSDLFPGPPPPPAPDARKLLTELNRADNMERSRLLKKARGYGRPGNLPARPKMRRDGTYAE